MNPADEELPFDYELSMLDCGTADHIDDKLVRWITAFREFDPEIGFFSGARGRLDAVASAKDLPGARARIKRKCSHEGDDESSIFLRWGIGKPARHSFLSINPAVESGFRWNLSIGKRLLTNIIVDAPKRAAHLFRVLVAITHPHRADWCEFRNFALICCGWYEKKLDGFRPTYMPRSYPEQAVPYESLLSPGHFSFRYPVCVWWHNYWCREIVDEIGRSVVLTTPAAQVVEAQDGGVFIHLCVEPFTIDRPDHLLAQRRAVEHLNLRALQVKHANPRKRPPAP